ncbi:hypothetical protein DFAR_3690022 [Desulfarculales bacterium]
MFDKRHPQGDYQPHGNPRAACKGADRKTCWLVRTLRGAQALPADTTDISSLFAKLLLNKFSINPNGALGVLLSALRPERLTYGARLWHPGYCRIAGEAAPLG